MSAYIEGKDHIDALVAMGLRVSGFAGRGLKWYDPAVPKPDDGYEAGEVWGPGAIGWARAAERELTPETADRVGAMLWAENVRSVCFRYNEAEDATNLPGPIGFNVMDVAAYRFEDFPELSEAGTIQAIGGYEYQSCEHPGWETSEAFAFCAALRDAMVNRIVERELANDPRSYHEVTREPGRSAVVVETMRPDAVIVLAPTAVATRSGRAPSGRLRNFASMGEAKLRAVHAAIVAEDNDPKARAAAESALARKLLGSGDGGGA